MKTFKIISYCNPRPEHIATLTMDDEGLFACDHEGILATLERGILTAPPWPRRQVYPTDGAVFWGGIPFHYTGLVRAVEE